MISGTADGIWNFFGYCEISSHKSWVYMGVTGIFGSQFFKSPRAVSPPPNFHHVSVPSYGLISACLVALALIVAFEISLWDLVHDVCYSG